MRPAFLPRIPQSGAYGGGAACPDALWAGPLGGMAGRRETGIKEGEPDMNFEGIVIGAVCFLVIGLFHPIVIKAEYYWSAKCWPVFLAAGLFFLGVSLAAGSVLASAALGVVGCSCLWSILELKEQEKRVKRGWFPKRPERRRRRKGPVDEAGSR